MSTYKELMARALRGFPALYPDPLDAIVEMLGSSGNYEWTQSGELVQTYETRDGLSMDYSDLEKRQAELDEDKANEIDCLRTLNNSEQFSILAERQRRELLDSHMDEVVEGKCTETYFRAQFHQDSKLRKLIRAEDRFSAQARFLDFPDNITADWGQVIQELHEWLDFRMNMEYGVSASGSKQNWPENAQHLSQQIQSSRERLYSLLNNGESYQSHVEQMNDLADKLIGELLEEERGAQPTPKTRRPTP